MSAVIEIDPADGAALRSFWEVEQAAQRADRTHPQLPSWTAFAAMLDDPSPYRDHQLIGAVHDGDLVAVADLMLPTRDNLHLAELEIDVLPRARRRGYGRALHAEAVRRARIAGRTTVVAEVLQPDDGGSSASSFAHGLGYQSRHVEDHLVLALPRPTTTGDPTGGSGTAADSAYEILTWTGRCPDVWRTVYLAMRNQMNRDVPIGEVDYELPVLDDERLAVEERRSARAHDVLVAAARHRTSGGFAGYSLVYLPHGETIALQEDTLVMPDHRGHRLAATLKGANYAVVAAAHPQRTDLHTWTDPDNVAMYRTNTALGFVPVERMHEMELRIGA